MLKIDLYHTFGRVVFFLLVSFVLIAGNLSLMLSLFVAEYLLITKVLKNYDNVNYFWLMVKVLMWTNLLLVIYN